MAEACAKEEPWGTSEHVPRELELGLIASSFPQAKYYFPHHSGGRTALVMVRPLPKSTLSQCWIERLPLVEDAAVSKPVFGLVSRPFNRASVDTVLAVTQQL